MPNVFARSIHQYIRQEYGQENVKTFRKWERTEKKMADFKNHRRFLLRCLDNNIIPVSLKLKSNLKTAKVMNIIRKTERALLNERIRMINHTIEMFEHEKDTCIEELSKVLNQEDMAECSRFMFKTKEDRHYKTMAWQKNKLERLGRKNEDKEGGCINKHVNRQSKEKIWLSPVRNNVTKQKEKYSPIHLYLCE